MNSSTTEKKLSDIIWENHIKDMSEITKKLNKGFLHRPQPVVFTMDPTGTIKAHNDAWYMEHLSIIEKFCIKYNLSFFLMHGHPNNKQVQIIIHKIHTDKQKRDKELFLPEL